MLPPNIERNLKGYIKHSEERFIRFRKQLEIGWKKKIAG